MGEERITEQYRIIDKEAFGEIVEKKSRFIASMSFVESEEGAVSYIESIRKKYYDARHHCFAFIIGAGSELERCSDDGEPSGTAGRPMLEALRGAGLTNIVCVVTRYFGGTLLGTGGLARAYAQAALDAVDHAEIVTMHYGTGYKVTVDYTLAGKMQYLFAERQIKIEDTIYTDKVEFHVLVPSGLEESMKKDIIEMTAAKAQIEKGDCTYYAAE